MPDVRLPDGTVVRNVPEGMTRGQLVMRLGSAGIKLHGDQSDGLAKAVEDAKPPSALETFGRGLIQGATANFGDEAIAGAEALTGPNAYSKNLQSERDANSAGAKENPIADITGNVVGTIAGPGKFLKAAKSIKGAVLGNAVLGGIMGFGAGEGGAQNRLENAGIGAGVSGATALGLGGIGKAFQAIRPANVAAKYVNGQFANSPMAADSGTIANDIGQVYTPGQATGSRSLLTMEGLVRRHPASADTMQAFDERQLQTSLANLDNNLNMFTTKASGPDVAGQAVNKSFDDVLSKAASLRNKQAKADFGKVDELAGRYRVIKPTNLLDEIDTIAKDFSAPGGGDASASLVSQIQGIKSALERAGPDGLSAKETQRLLQIYGSAAHGTGAVFKDLDTAQQRGIARRLQNSLLEDVDAAADNGGHVGEIASSLKAARDNYRQNSQQINSLEDSVLGRMFGGDYKKAPERVAEAMKNMKPTELNQSISILNKSDPETSQIVKRYLVEDAISQAGRNTSSAAPQVQIAGETQFSAPKFLTAIRKSNVWSAMSPTERTSMTTAVRDLERVAFRAGTDGSPTAPLQQALGLLSRPVTQVAGGALLGGGLSAVSGGDIKEGAIGGATVGGLGGMAIPRFAKLITTPAGQAALRTMRVSNPNSKAYAGAASAITALIADSADGDNK